MTNGASSVLTDNSYHALRILRISGDGDLYSQFMQPCYRCWFTSHKVLKLSQMLLMMSKLSIGWPSETALGNLSTLSLLQKPAWPARILTHVQNAEPHRQCSWWTFSITTMTCQITTMIKFNICQQQTTTCRCIYAVVLYLQLGVEQIWSCKISSHKIIQTQQPGSSCTLSLAMMFPNKQLMFTQTEKRTFSQHRQAEISPSGPLWTI